MQALRRSNEESSCPDQKALSSKAGLRRFLVRFVAYALLFEVVYFAWFSESEAFGELMTVNASVAAALLRTLGFGVASEQNDLFSETFRVQVLRGCDGLEPLALFLIAVVASPTGVRAKVAPVLIGTAGLLIINILRIASLFLIGSYYSTAFSFAHLVFWPLALVLLAFLGWARWAWYACGR